MTDVATLAAMLCGTVGLCGLTVTAGIGWLRAVRRITSLTLQRDRLGEKMEGLATASRNALTVYRDLADRAYIRNERGQMQKYRKP